MQNRSAAQLDGPVYSIASIFPPLTLISCVPKRLENASFFDTVGGGNSLRAQGTEPISFSSETDQLYLNTKTTCTIDDAGLKRRITIKKSGSNSTVVWNPWIAKAKAMPDFGDEEWPKMLCVETANARENAVTVAAGERQVMEAEIGVGA